MEMSIDKSITELEILKKNTFSYTSAYQAFTTAIDTMRKYQKIQEIINDFREYQHPLYLTEFYKKICEVIEDGKIEDKDIDLHIDRETLLQEYIPKAQYEARLKADMVAMLEGLKQDFIAEAYGIEMDCTDYVVNVADIDKIIQQKINALKENNHDD